MCFAPQRRALFRHLNLQKWSENGVFCAFDFEMWRHNGVHFFDISTSKSGPNVVCFVHFDLETCFAPQRRALFRHLNFQKWSEPGVFCTFWLGNVLRATTACTFSTSQLPKVVREWCVLYILTSKCASRHNGVQFFLSPLARWLRTRRFSEPTFSTLRSHKSLEKHSVLRLSYLFAHLHLLSSYSFSSTLLSSNLSLLSASSLLCFSSLHIVGSLTSKLPSTNWYVEKVHAVVARSTFPSQNVQNTPGSDHFWKLRCRKSARRCGAKHISKWKCTKHYMFAPLLEVQMSKKRTPLCREAHFEVKMYKTLGDRTTLGGSDVASPLRFTTLHYVTFHHTPLYYTTLHYTTLHNTTTTTTQLDYTPVHSTTLNFTTLHYTTLRSTTLHYIKLHYTPLHYTTLRSATLQLQLHNYTPLHSTTLNYTTLHYITLHYTPLHYTPLHYITLHYLPLHFTTLHYTPLHYNYNYDYTTTLHYTKLHCTTLHYTTLHYIPLHYTTLHYTTIHWMTLHHR